MAPYGEFDTEPGDLEPTELMLPLPELTSLAPPGALPPVMRAQTVRAASRGQARPQRGPVPLFAVGIFLFSVSLGALFGLALLLILARLP